MRKDLDVTLFAYDIIMIKKLVEFVNIFLGRFVALKNFAPSVKKMFVVMW